MTSLAPGHPKYTKAALFDIISPDITSGPTAAAAELISVASDCLNFPTLAQNYDIHVSHSKSQFKGNFCVLHHSLYFTSRRDRPEQDSCRYTSRRGRYHSPAVEGSTLYQAFDSLEARLTAEHGR